MYRGNEMIYRDEMIRKTIIDELESMRRTKEILDNIGNGKEGKTVRFVKHSKDGDKMPDINKPTECNKTAPAKPPIGLKPKFIHESERVKDIQDAIRRYLDVDMPIPLEWIYEYNDIINK